MNIDFSVKEVGADVFEVTLRIIRKEALLDLLKHITLQRPEQTPIAFTTEEGGDWLPWHTYPSTIGSLGRIFAIKFSDGWILDPISGWREQRP